MSARSKGLGATPTSVRVIDTSSLIELEKLVPVTEQWPLLVTMSELVREGRLAFPR